MSDEVVLSVLLDENIERQIGAYLHAEGHDVHHVVDVLEPGADDTADITPYAVAHDLAIVTKDTDFLEMDTSDHEGVFFIGDHHVPAYEIAMAIARIAEAVPDRDDLRDVIFVDSWLS